MKWMIVRMHDENSSPVCEAIEAKALREGGLTFPFTVDVNGHKYTYNEETLTTAIWTTGNFHTNLFHPHCRSHLVPIGEESNLLHPDTGFDEIDEMMLTEGALNYSAETQLRESEEIPENIKHRYFINKVRLKAKQIRNFVGRLFA